MMVAFRLLLHLFRRFGSKSSFSMSDNELLWDDSWLVRSHGFFVSVLTLHFGRDT